MQTERVTFLTTPDHKAALDAFASSNGMSVGHVVREATTRYLTEPTPTKGEAEEALELILPEIESMLPEWNAKMDRMEASLDRAHRAVRDALAKVDGMRVEHV